MTNDEKEQSYHIRIKGRVFGPYTLRQLDKLRARGQFSQSNEISTDRETWESAGTLDALFGSTKKKASVKEAASINADQIAESKADAWYCSINDQQQGPMTLEELQGMLDDGRLNLNDMVWKEGMADWLPASDRQELNRAMPVNHRNGKKRRDKSHQDTGATSSNDMPPHFLDYVLNAMRSVGGEDFIWASGPGAVELGRYAFYVAIVSNLIFCFFYAIKLNSVDAGVAGVACAAFGLALQYSAVKSCGAIRRLIRATTLRMSSTAFLDSMVFIFLIGGVVTLSISAIVWIRTQDFTHFVVGIVLFLLCEQLGLMLLHPTAIGITISDKAGPGEEAIALLAFYMMLPLRSVPSVFAIGSVLSVLGTGAAIVFLLNSKVPDSDDLRIAFGLGSMSALLMLGSAAYPITLYAYFIAEFLIVDLLRSRLVVPGKLDHILTAISDVSRNDISTNDDNHKQHVSPESALQ